MSQSFTFTPKEADLLAALRLHYDRIQVKHLLYFAAFCALVGLSVSLLAGDTDMKETLIVMGGTILFGTVAVVILRVVMRILWLPRYVRRVYKQQADLHQEIMVQWDENFFTTQTPNALVHTPWKDFHLWSRNESMMMLYRSEALFNFFPLTRPELNAAAHAMERHLLNAGVKRRP